ncbi:MAG: methyltransferase domain-containing protein [Candidatus Bathyarchaeota archaeon]|nr:MAG: methyltransferase domain-containing protein [Candidatus Bathyarchaeota archaeon]
MKDVEQAKVEYFGQKVLADTSGFAATIMAALGDRLGLFKDLAANGPTSSSDLTKRTGISKHYAKEWLAGMTSAGYIKYDPTTQLFTLPAEHIPVLAQEEGPFFIGGTHQMILGMLTIIDLLEDAFRSGKGIPMEAYGSNTWEGMERDMIGLYKAKLLHEWFPAMPKVQSMLEKGVQVADVGCGTGRISIMLAQAFPKSRYVGIDIFKPLIDRAKSNAEAAGVSDLVKYEVLDASQGLHKQYNLVTAFDVIHETNPLLMLQAIRRSLLPNGRFVCVDVKCEKALEDNINPRAALRYGFSLLFCMSIALANEGKAQGTMGLPEETFKQLCLDAGFKSVRFVPLEKSNHNLYEAET